MSREFGRYWKGKATRNMRERIKFMLDNNVGKGMCIVAVIMPDEE